MDKFNKYSFIFGLGSVVVPCALYFLFQQLFGVRPTKLVINDKPSTENVVVAKETKKEVKKTVDNDPVPVKVSNVPDKSSETKRVRILYGTCTGTARHFAEKLRKRIDSCTKYVVEVTDLKDYNEDNLDKEEIVLFICSTWSEGRPPETAALFFEWLKDYATDFRVSKDHLTKVKYAVFGLGGDIYEEFYAKAPKDIHNYMEVLGATPILPVEFGDDASDLEMKYNKWSSRVATEVQNIYRNETKGTSATTTTGAGKTSDHQSATNKFHKQQKQVKAESKNAKSAKSAAAATATATAAKSATPSTSTGCCNENKSSTEGSTCCGGGGASAANGNDDEEVLEEEEEDLINNHYVTMDQVEDGVQPAPPKVKRVVKGKVAAKKSTSGGGCCGSSSNNGAEHTHNDNSVPDLLPPLDEDEEADGGDDNDDEGDYDDEKDGPLVDLEDIGSKMDKAKRSALKAQLSAAADGADGGEEVKREMVTKLQRKALTKEGYRIIGTHSAVKLCRWTKNQMRGRGGCYKHSFYGITSYQCMEATPSLACANKCVFCWRHHKNPVGTEWRWKEDEPDFIVNEAVELHRGMINEMRGVPGVQPERLLEAFKVRHCALSLVGEPIMYPRINEMLKCLHDREISTFMVTNAQFPDRIAELDPVTQLYVSVDASNKESLKAIDRPLFKDFWERFLASLKAMSEKRQRTVYRMTLVSGWNMNEDGYVELIESGLPDFIEIKAMTYCGKSDASSLTMQNVPWHKDVCEYGEAICRRLVERGVISTRYSIATEHEHSCCILLAREDKFKVDGVWNTWINYPKFNALIQNYYASGRTATFTSEDYMAPTPDWALYRSAARGFDPEENRWHRNKTTGQLVENEYKSSDSGCG